MQISLHLTTRLQTNLYDTYCVQCWNSGGYHSVCKTKCKDDNTSSWYTLFPQPRKKIKISLRQQNFRAQRAIQRNPDCKNYLLKDKCLVYDYKNPSHNPCTVESGDKSGRAKKRIDTYVLNFLLVCHHHINDHHCTVVTVDVILLSAIFVRVYIYTLLLALSWFFCLWPEWYF